MDQPTRRRRRPAISCVECRRRKIRCSRGNPCAHCVSVNVQCVYKVYDDDPEIIHQSQAEIISNTTHNISLTPVPAASQQTGGGASNFDHGDPPIRSRLTPAVVSTQTPSSDTNGARTAARGRATTSNRLGDGDSPGHSDLRNLVKRVQKLEESSASNPIYGLSETNRDILAQQSGLQDSHTILNKTRILGWSHWMGTSKEVITGEREAPTQCTYYFTNHVASFRPFIAAIRRLWGWAMEHRSKAPRPRLCLLKWAISLSNAKQWPRAPR